MNEIGFDRFRIQLIEDYPCSDKYELRQREGYWIRQMGTLNMKVAGRTQQSKDYKELVEYFDNTKGSFGKVKIGDVFEVVR